MGTVKERWEEGSYEKEVRIAVRCTSNENHAKILRFDARRISFETAREMAETFTGQGPAFILKPGPLCPIGKCAVCGGQLKATVEELFHAEHSQPVNKSRRKPR